MFNLDISIKQDDFGKSGQVGNFYCAFSYSFMVHMFEDNFGII